MHGSGAYLEIVGLFEFYTQLACIMARRFEHDVTPRKYERNGELWLRLQGIEAKQAWILRGKLDPSEWLDICGACRAAVTRPFVTI